jgi:hypothetical protein
MGLPINVSMPSMAQSGVTAAFGNVSNAVQSALRPGSGTSQMPLVLAAAAGLALAFLTRKRG